MNKNSIPSVVAISTIAWILVNIFHEIIGHAGMGLLSGLDLKAVNTTTADFDVNWDKEIAENGFFHYRLFLIGGALVNFLTGFAALLFLRNKKVRDPNLRLFLWLFASFSYVIVVMNLVTAPLTGGRDFAGIIQSYDKQTIPQVITLFSGLAIMAAGFIVIQRSFMPVLKGFRRIGLILAGIPVITVLIVQSLSIVQSPFASLPASQNHLLASVFAYFHLVLWAIVVVAIPVSNRSLSIKKTLPVKSNLWMIFSLIALVLFIFILGPGIGSFEGHPGLR